MHSAADPSYTYFTITVIWQNCYFLEFLVKLSWKYVAIKHRKLIILLGKNIAVSVHDAKTMLKAYSLNFFVFCHLNLHKLLSVS